VRNARIDSGSTVRQWYWYFSTIREKTGWASEQAARDAGYVIRKPKIWSRTSNGKSIGVKNLTSATQMLVIVYCSVIMKDSGL